MIMKISKQKEIFNKLTELDEKVNSDDFIYGYKR